MIEPTAPVTMRGNLLEAAARHLPGWMIMACGLTLLAAAVLMPAWLEVRTLGWQKQVMQLQADRLADQTQAYDQFHRALAADDPVLLERLAFHHLRVKPVSVQPLVPQRHREADPALARHPSGPLDRKPATMPIADLPTMAGAIGGSVDLWLQIPLPREGIDYAPLPPVTSRLARLTQGRPRLGLLVVAGIFVFAGLQPPSRPTAGRLRRELRPRWQIWA